MASVDPELYPKIIAKRTSGWSLRKLGKEFGVTGERIRQILKAEGYVYDDAAVREERAKVRQERLESARERLALGESVTDVPRDVRKEAHSLLSDEEWLEAEFLRRTRRGARSLTEEEWEERRASALTALREASEQFGSDSLSMSQYHEYRKANAVPSEQWITRMFGSWSEGLRAAGLSPRRPVREYPRIPDGVLLSAVEAFTEFAVDDRTPLTADNYGVWSKKHGAPSRETLLARFGQWREVLRLVQMRKELNGNS